MQKPNPFEHSCWRTMYIPVPPAGSGGCAADISTERTCPACAYERGVATVVAATGTSRVAIEAGVVLLMRDVCGAVAQAHRESRGLDTLDEKIRAQEDNLTRIMGMLALRDANVLP